MYEPNRVIQGPRDYTPAYNLAFDGRHYFIVVRVNGVAVDRLGRWESWEAEEARDARDKLRHIHAPTFA